MADHELYQRVYSLFDEATPIPGDCGDLCGSICCSSPDIPEEEMYIYLLPGEMEYLKEMGAGLEFMRLPAKFHNFPRSWGKYVYTAKCTGPGKCPRRFRPIQCRTFPLEPHLDEDGKLGLIYCDVDLPYTCPLISEKMKLSGTYVSSVLEAWELLIGDSLIRDLVELDSRGRKSYERYVLK
ncbi:MAG: hypothetical protein K6G58_02130 [Lachnospiraceae bacterium]|nr:hypothetical protein [Lachnospiraceae bacterium]